MIEFRKALSAKLTAINSEVYHQRASDNAEFPYLVYEITNIDYGGEPGSDIYYIEIEGWDKSETGDTTILETLMAAVKAGLEKQTITHGSITAAFFIENQLALDNDNDEQIIRRRQSYQAKVYERS